jgi:hypothetical protein
VTPSREENIQERQGEDINDIILDLGAGRTTESIVKTTYFAICRQGSLPYIFVIISYSNRILAIITRLQGSAPRHINTMKILYTASCIKKCYWSLRIHISWSCSLTLSDLEASYPSTCNKRKEESVTNSFFQNMVYDGEYVRGFHDKELI